MSGTKGTNIFAKQAPLERWLDKEKSDQRMSTVLDIDKIDENPRNELIFNMDGIEDLAEYIKEVGFHQPIVVFRKENERYEVVSGHRKLRAKKLNGDNKIESVVIQAPESEGDKAYQLIFDNVNARTLKPLDMARAMNEIKNVWIPEQREKGNLTGDTKDILAEKFKMSSSKVSRYLRLLNLNPKLQDNVDDGIIAVDAALVLLQDQYIDVEGLQDYISELVAEQMKSEEEISITKAEIIKMIKNFFESTKQNDGESNKSKESIVTKKKFVKAVNAFKTILSSKYEEKFILDEDEVQFLKELRDKLENLIEEY
jgi:ParB family chromosome partitioning protein